MAPDGQRRRSIMTLAARHDGTNPWLDTRAIDITRLRGGKECARRRNERAKVDEPVGRCVEDDHSNSGCRHVLLELQILIYGDEGVEARVAHTGKEDAICAALPAEVSHVRNIEPGEFTLKRPRRRFVEEDPHSTRRSALEEQ